MPHGKPRKAFGFERVGVEIHFAHVADFGEILTEHPHDDRVMHAAAGNPQDFGRPRHGSHGTYDGLHSDGA